MNNEMKSREMWTTVQFLGIPVPDQPFPNVNDTPMMQKNIRLAQTFVTMSWSQE